jgi:hypothetical protein
MQHKKCHFFYHHLLLHTTPKGAKIWRHLLEVDFQSALVLILFSGLMQNIVHLAKILCYLRLNLTFNYIFGVYYIQICSLELTSRL